MLIPYALKSTAVLAAAALLALVLHRRSAAARHLVWTASASAVLALPLLIRLLPALNLPAAAAAQGPAVIFRALAIGRSATSSLVPASATLPATSSPGASAIAIPWLALLWAAGAAFLFLRLAVAWISTARLRRAARPSPLADAAALARSLGIRQPVAILETPAVTMPMTCGVLRPVVLLPAGAFRWNPARFRVVLLHELAHVRRGDVAAHLLARLALCLNWWNPLAWFAWRQLTEEGERAADDLVLAAGERASDYAGQLLEIARGFQPSPVAWAALAMARPGRLEVRLRAILDARANRRPAARLAPFAAVLAALALVAPFAALRAQDAALPAEVPVLTRAAIAQNNYALLDQAAVKYEQLHQFDVARHLLESALPIRAQVYGARSPEYAAGLVKLGGLAARIGRTGEATADYTQAIALGDRPEVSPALSYLGFQAYAAGQTAPAEDYFQRLLAADPSGAEAGPALTWLAAIRQSQPGRKSEAEPLLQRAMSAEDKSSPAYATTLDVYALYLAKAGRKQEAEEARNKATDVLRHAPHTVAAGPTRPGVLRIAAGIQPPRLLYKTEPSYDEADRTAGVAGTVMLSVEIAPDGRAHNALITRSLTPGLDAQALAAISQWQFRPASREGTPVTVQATIEVNFRLL